MWTVSYRRLKTSRGRDSRSSNATATLAAPFAYLRTPPHVRYTFANRPSCLADVWLTASESYAPRHVVIV